MQPITRLVPRGLVPLIVVLASVCALVVTTLGLIFAGQRTGTAVDDSVHWAVYRQFVGERGLLQAMLTPTEPVLLVIVIGLIVMVAVARGRPRLAVLAVAAPLLSAVFSSAVLKPAFGRTINNGSLAFPSGHTATMVAVLTVLVIATVTTRTTVLVLTAVGALVVAVIGATALVGMKYHYVTDTVGGACVAIATVLTVALVIDRVADRRVRKSVPVEQPATSGTR
ncbi:phosphatase PAP2 family protein [Actinosynnema sp. ALI-1.44]|uniref:phosphatase PAP2 family protein n=1 Tax=Actinosynnema sp. ALI-1.44 TaxID=1933779 RepID=UPI00143D1443|nr:phosphatase PAP2 family protein [Actinosynnema sp. ALI-1.44]